jgi:hypothetical protein
MAAMRSARPILGETFASRDPDLAARRVSPPSRGSTLPQARLADELRRSGRPLTTRDLALRIVAH